MSFRKLVISLSLAVIMALAGTSVTFASSTAPHHTSASLTPQDSPTPGSPTPQGSSSPQGSPQQPKPLYAANGGGCSTKASNVAGGAWISDEACISGDGNWRVYDVYPDGYITYNAPAGYLWTACTLFQEIVQDGNVIWSASLDCTGDAQQGGTHHYVLPTQDGTAPFWPCPTTYYDYFSVTATYNGQQIFVGWPSPNERITC